MLYTAWLCRNVGAALPKLILLHVTSKCALNLVLDLGRNKSLVVLEQRDMYSRRALAGGLEVASSVWVCAMASTVTGIWSRVILSVIWMALGLKPFKPDRRRFKVASGIGR